MNNNTSSNDFSNKFGGSIDFNNNGGTFINNGPAFAGYQPNGDRGENKSPIPAVTAPKGGGSIRGIGEKFQANAVTGSGSFSIPVAVTAGRSGFQPAVSIEYNSGGGNSPFGLGWNVGLPSVKRKTDKGLPRYTDEDTFLLSGAEDLIPLDNHPVMGNGDLFFIRFRPRTEGLFSRIEMVENGVTGEIYWQTVSKSNVTTIYGQSADCRIADPENGSRVYEWLIEKSYDSKGNMIHYRYKQENKDNISFEQPSEFQRRDCNFAARYLKQIDYGNSLPYEGQQDFKANSDWHFSLIFDYGEHDPTNPSAAEVTKWPVRQDPFSYNKGGFEIRNYRLCRRVLMLHNFPELGSEPLVVKSTDINYNENPTASYPVKAVQSGYLKNDQGIFQTKSLPPLEFCYSDAVAPADLPLKSLRDGSGDNLPVGLDGSEYQWLDLNGDGISGVLTKQGDAFYYKPNEGNGTLGQMELLGSIPRPAASRGDGLTITDIDGDGKKELVINNGVMQGYFSYEKENWQPFTPFKKMPIIDFSNPNMRMIDLNGDGHADLLITENNLFYYYPSKAKEGYDRVQIVDVAKDEEKGPAVIFADLEQSIYLADMTGDGLTDIVRIKNGSVCYWPNFGYGRFGSKITMNNSPRFDFQGSFNQSYLKLGDIDGSGTTDILYFGKSKARYWRNNSGNGYSEAVTFSNLPPVNGETKISLVDLMGNGTSCLVYSTGLPGRETLKYIDLMDGEKPYLLKEINNNMGKITRLNYCSSIKFYLADKQAGKPWKTKLPFPVQVLESVENEDLITGAKITTSYKYHHGYFDGKEREFRGFGMVETTDCESFTEGEKGVVNIPPVLTKTWFHTGFLEGGAKMGDPYLEEYFQDEGQLKLPTVQTETAEGDEIGSQNYREAGRALKGSVLRSEVYALDGSAKEQIPYTVTASSYRVKELQQKSALTKHGIYYCYAEQTVNYHYERMFEVENKNEVEERYYDPRTVQEFVLKIDNFGNVVKQATLVHPRRDKGTTEQQEWHLNYSENDFINRDDNKAYLGGVPYQSKSYRIKNPLLRFKGIRDIKPELEKHLNKALLNIIPFEKPFSGIEEQAVLLSHTQNHYWDDTASAVALPDSCGRQILLHHSEQLVASEDHLLHPVSGLLTDVADAPFIRDIGGYRKRDGYYWKHSPTVEYTTKEEFYLEKSSTDVFGAVTKASYDGYYLIPIGSQDALGNESSVLKIDYRSLTPLKIADPNLNYSEVLTDPLGMVTAVSTYGSEELVPKGDKKLEGNYSIVGDLSFDDIVANPGKYLQQASSFHYYDMTPVRADDPRPLKSVTVSRDTHVSELAANEEPGYLVSIVYSDAFGRTLQEKVKVEAGEAFKRDLNGELVLENGKPVSEHTDNRWLVSGRTVYNNKEKPVMQYEPFYSSTHFYEEEAELCEYGVTPIIHYDPLLRVIRTDSPKGFFSKVEFTPWEVKSFDENDTVLNSDYYQNTINTSASELAEERAALVKATAHAHTPAMVELDSAGRHYKSAVMLESGLKLVTISEFDHAGNVCKITDPRQIKTFEYFFDLTGAKLKTVSADAGISRTLANAAGSPLVTLDSRGYRTEMEYDKLQRPLKISVSKDGVSRITEKYEYGESESYLDPHSEERYKADYKNMNTQLVRKYDSTGKDQIYAYSFKGQPLRSGKTIREEYKEEANWTDTVDIDNNSAIHTTAYLYDGTGKVLEESKPDGSKTVNGYHISGRLNNVKMTEAGAQTGKMFVNTIIYDAKGQREKIVYGNGTFTEYTYEDTTFRLVNLKTVRESDEKTLQDLVYTYDPVGNVVGIVDNSRETLFFDNEEVKPEKLYTYDSLYRLIESKGMEHASMASQNINSDYSFAGTMPAQNSGGAVRNYTDTYQYDGSGNMLFQKHTAKNNTYIKNYTYDIKSNRLGKIQPGGVHPDIDFFYDYSGNCTTFSNLFSVTWDCNNRLVSADLGGGGIAYYTYDSAGNRTRKVIEKNSVKIKETLYISGVEFFTQYESADTVKKTIKTNHVMDDKSRIATIEEVTENATTTTLRRFQLNDHLGSSLFEIAEDGKIISFEDYYAYGGSCYRFARSQTETAKRYRFNGKERDEETGLYYYGARYYASWMCRWVSCDPAGTEGSGLNMYWFCSDNPVSRVDMDGMSDFNFTQDDLGRKTYSDDIGSTSKMLNYQNRNSLSLGQKVDNFKNAYNNATDDDKNKIIATGVGAAGGVVPYAGDYISLGASCYLFAKDPSWSSIADVGLDTIGAIFPFLPAMGTLKRMERITDGVDAVHDLEKVADGASEILQSGNQFTKIGRKKSLKPNISYKNGNYMYKTDDLGRIKNAEGSLSLGNAKRNSYAQTTIGGSDRLSDDHGGHLIASIFEGSGDIDNLVPMNGNFNQSAWKKMENAWATALKNGANVDVNIKALYKADIKRPHKFVGSYSINGETTNFFFKNNYGGK